MFKSTNELDKFSFEDAELHAIEKAEDGLVFTVESLIVKPNNSQNTNFTESYAGTSLIKFNGGVIENIIKCGYKYYDANGVLKTEVPDESVVKLEWDSLIKSFPGNYLADLTCKDGVYTAEVEFMEEDGAGLSYLLEIKAGDIIVSWEKYMNRVQR